MSRGPQTFKQKDLTRAMKAANAAGMSVARYELSKDGKIVIVPGKMEIAAQADADAGTEANEWDKK